MGPSGCQIPTQLQFRRPRCPDDPRREAAEQADLWPYLSRNVIRILRLLLPPFPLLHLCSHLYALEISLLEVHECFFRSFFWMKHTNFLLIITCARASCQISERCSGGLQVLKIHLHSPPKINLITPQELLLATKIPLIPLLHI